MDKQPENDVLEAFAATGTPLLLSGGQGTTWVVGDIVLKPVGNIAETLYVADVMESIVENGFRVARPIKTVEGKWLYKNWCAYNRIDGEHVKARWDEKIELCKAFHKALSAYLKPEYLDKETNRYAVADRIAWQELPIKVNEKIMPVLEKLENLLRPIQVTNQLIHGDFTGNILFHEGQLPAVIDFVAYWRPANYAIAIMIADAIVWEGADESIFDLVSDIPEIVQLIIRAEIGRIMQLDGLLKEEGIDKLGEAEDHEKLIGILSSRNR